MKIDRHFVDEQFTQHFSELAISVDSTLMEKEQNKQSRALDFLDDSFPLDKGSHQDVTQYVMDYHHLLVYFSDGSHCGLRHPKQFIGIDGDSCSPNAILFSTQEGNHIEVELASVCPNRTGISINDIQVEVVSYPFSEHKATENIAEFHCWISLMRRNSAGRAIMSLEDKNFCHKDGHDFTISAQGDE